MLLTFYHNLFYEGHSTNRKIFVGCFALYHKKIMQSVFIVMFLFITLAWPGLAFGQSAQESFYGNRVTISATAAVVMDVDTGQILYAKNAHQPRPIASTTKIMTALIAIECGELNGVTTISPKAAGVEGSSIYLRAGEKLSLKDLLYGALMHSGNDACVAIAEHIAGREELFVKFMNYKAYRLGAKSTHFANTNGLPNDKHLSSAYDLALITRYAMKNPVFNKIVATKTTSINGPKGRRSLCNTNKMLWSYRGADGVKTGTTNAAGKCLVSSATRDGRRLLAVVLHSDDRFRESIRLLDYGFKEFNNQRLVRREEVVSYIGVRDGVNSKVPVTVSRDLVITLPVNKDKAIEKIIMTEQGLSAPVKPGLEVGKLQVLVEDKPVAEVELITKGRVDELPPHQLIWRNITTTFIE